MSEPKLLDIQVTEDKMEQFLLDLQMVKKITSQFGQDISHLFGEICLLYEITGPEDLTAPPKGLIRTLCVFALNSLAQGLNQTNDLIAAHENSTEATLTSTDYDKVYEVLKTILSSYVGIIQIVILKRYLSPEFLASIHERLQFLLCTEFEELRARFKVVESTENQQDVGSKVFH